MFVGIISLPHSITSQISLNTLELKIGPYLVKIAQINILHFCNIFQWIIIKLVCWLNPLAKFNNQPDPMKFSAVMALELTQNLTNSTLFVGMISCPSLLTN